VTLSTQDAIGAKAPQAKVVANRPSNKIKRVIKKPWRLSVAATYDQ
jgi:hypothetical protein